MITKNYFILLSLVFGIINAQEYVDKETGEISDYFKKQLETVGIKPLSCNGTDVYNALKECGCLQDNYNLYRDGGSSNFELTYKQATSSLELEYAARKERVPTKCVESDVLVPMGVLATLKKRVAIIEKLRSLNYSIAKLHFIGREDDRSTLNELLQSEKGINDLEYDIKTTTNKDNLFQTCLALLTLKTNNLYVAADEPFGSKMSDWAKEFFEKRGYSSLGYASFPEKDWTNDIKEFGYNNEKLQDEQAQAIAFCKSSWNMHTRKLHAELEKLKDKQNK